MANSCVNYEDSRGAKIHISCIATKSSLAPQCIAQAGQNALASDQGRASPIFAVFAVIGRGVTFSGNARAGDYENTDFRNARYRGARRGERPRGI